MSRRRKVSSSAGLCSSCRPVIIRCRHSVPGWILRLDDGSQVKNGYTEDAEFDPEKVKKGSVAAAGLCKWVHAMVLYHRVAKVVAPKRAALSEAEEALAGAMEELGEKQGMLKVTDLGERKSSSAVVSRFSIPSAPYSKYFIPSERDASDANRFERASNILVPQDLMEKLTTLQHNLKEAENKKITLQQQV